MKKMQKLSLVLIMAFVAAVAFATPTYAREPAMISVNGEGTINVQPDVAHIFLGVETQDVSAVAAQQANNAEMNNIIAAIRAHGIAESDIQTTHISMFPVHQWTVRGEWMGMGGEEMEVVGYRVSNNISITVRDIDAVGQIMADATAAGANMSSHVSFSVEDSSAIYNQALALAVADARSKADAIASALGVRLGNVMHVSDMGPTFMPMRHMDFGMLSAMPAAAGAAVPVQTGEISIVARVHVSFAAE